MLLFYTPWKHQKTFKFSDVFRDIEKQLPAVISLFQKTKLVTSCLLIQKEKMLITLHINACPEKGLVSARFMSKQNKNLWWIKSKIKNSFVKTLATGGNWMDFPTLWNTDGRTYDFPSGEVYHRMWIWWSSLNSWNYNTNRNNM